MSGGGGGKPGDQTVGYRYYMGLHAGLCHGPVDELVEIRGGDITLWTGSQTASGSISINADSAYGGDKKEGGVKGQLDVMMGESTQGANSYLSSVLGGIQSAYRGLLTLVFRRGLIGANTPYPKPWYFRVRRATKGWDNDNPWYPAKAQIAMSGTGAQLSLSKPLASPIHYGTRLIFGGSITTYAAADANTGDNQITVLNITGITSGMGVDDPDGNAIQSGTSINIVAGPAIKAMNPAHIVYETLTNRDWGMGYPASIINATSFTAAADQLYSEGFGLCLLWMRQDSIESFLQNVMNHIGGVLVQNRTTGLFELNLIRGGYTVSSLPHFTADNVLDMQSYESPSITGATNEVTVNWVDPTTRSKRYTVVQSLGSIQSQGVIVSQTKDYQGIPTVDLAARVAQRDLRATSVPLKKLTVKLDRSAYALLPGGLFVLTFPAYGIDTMVFRVGEVDYGNLTDGAVTVTAVQDVFSLPATTFVQPQGTAWVAPDTTPRAPSYYTAFDATYRDLYLGMTATDLGNVQATNGYACMLAARPTGLSIDYEVWSRVGGAAYARHGLQNFCPTGILQAAIAPFDTAVTLLAGQDLDQVVLPCAALIDNEIVAVTALDPTTGVATIGRGCVDTVPVAHAASARVWLFDNYVGGDKLEYFAGESVNLQPLTVTTGGTLVQSSAPTLTASIVARQNMPYPPAYLSVNGTRWDSVAQLSGQLNFSWRERNRLTQQDQLIDNTAGTITPEAGTTYTVTLTDINGTGFYTITGVTGTAWTWPAPDDVHSTIGAKVTAVRGGVSSYQSQTLPPTNRTGWGLNFGNNFGG